MGAIDNVLKPPETPSPLETASNWKTICYVIASRVLNQAVDTEYAYGTMSIRDKVAHVKFRAQKEMPDELIEVLNKNPMPKNIEEFSHQNEIFAQNSLIDPITRVNAVVLDIDFSYHPIGAAILPCIGDLCQSTFPKRQIHLSQVDIQSPQCQGLTCIGLLFPGAEDLDRSSLKGGPPIYGDPFNG